VDAQGKPAGGLPIFMHGDDQPERAGFSDVNGMFMIDRICEGEVRLQASFDSSPGGAGYLKAEGGDTNVRIVLGKEGVHLRYVSLLDKPLPDTNDLGIDPSAVDVKDKKLIVCFFDMQQRPSRHWVAQLAKRTEELEEKGTVVVGVQASKVERSDLNEWVKKQGIPFPVGMIAGDDREQRFAWGIKSLPWLILADTEHMVVAEGFAVGDVDKQLAGVEGEL
jgi:hypothetical protein